jgi:hypothetical protein|tara:strand:- start:181 stop:450 length:270 start_codon:yes stop_codon:yes gene_type:complete
LPKGISEESQIHISIAFLIKSMVAVAVVVGSWYQAQMRFANIETRLNDMHEEVVVLSSKVSTMEANNVKQLEETIIEQKSLLQKIGLKK